MKCVRLLQTKDVYRVSNVMAAVTVNMGQAVYVPKSVWKNSGRKYTKGLNKEEKEK